MENIEQTTLAQRLAQALSAQMGFPVGVDDAGGRITLTGTADSQDARAEAADSVALLAPGVTIQNNIRVDPSIQKQGNPPYDDSDLPADETPPRGSTSLEATESSDLDAGFTDQPLETNEINVADESVPDYDVEAEPDPTFFAPTDPVMSTDDQGAEVVMGGFSATSMTEDQVDLSTIDHQPGDEAIADAVRRELREDAETTDLEIEVVVENGVVYLRGTVPTVDDAEDAEEVASRVPGVREVREELEVPGV